jgi:hypothetical protein
MPDRKNGVKVVERRAIRLLSVVAHMFQNGTRAFPVEFAALVDVGQVLCYRGTLRPEKICNPFLRQPERLVFETDVEPKRLVRLIDDDWRLCRDPSFRFDVLEQSKRAGRSCHSRGAARVDTSPAPLAAFAFDR